MSTIELDVRRAEIIRQLFEIDSVEVLNSVKRSVSRAIHRQSKETAIHTEELTPPCRFTLEELNRELDEGEAEEAVGLTLPHEEVMGRIRKHITAL